MPLKGRTSPKNQLNPHDGHMTSSHISRSQSHDTINPDASSHHHSSTCISSDHFMQLIKKNPLYCSFLCCHLSICVWRGAFMFLIIFWPNFFWEVWWWTIFSWSDICLCWIIWCIFLCSCIIYLFSYIIHSCNKLPQSCLWELKRVKLQCDMYIFNFLQLL